MVIKLTENEDIEVILSKTSELKKAVEGDEKATALVEDLEELLKNPEYLAVAGIKKLSKEKSLEELTHVIDKMRKDEEVRRFIEISRFPWGANRTILLLMQFLWIITAAISFMMGVYLFFPPYVFFGRIHGNATATIQKTLELISKNPQVLTAIDPLFKVIGFVMMAIAIASLYQAHLLRTYLRE